MNEYLEKFMEEKYGELYNEEYYPAITEEQLTEYLGEGGLETLKEADDATINAKIEKILTDENLTPYEQMQMLESIKNYSEEVKAQVDNYFKNDDTYFSTQLDKMMNAQNDDGTSKYSADDLLAFVRQYKNLDNTSSVLGQDDKVGDKSQYQELILKIYERMENSQQVQELEGYLDSNAVLELSEDVSGEKSSRLLNALAKGNLQDDGKLSLDVSKYNISQEDADAAKAKFIDGSSNSQESMKAILEATQTGELSKDMAKYLLAEISTGDSNVLLSELQNMTAEEQKAYTNALFGVFSNDSEIKEPTTSTDTKNVDDNKPAETLEEFLASVDDPWAKKWYETMFTELGYDYDTFWNTSNIPRDFQSVYTDKFASGTIRSAGCGITSLSMLSEYLTGEHITPPELTRGYRGDNPASALEKNLNELGIQWERKFGADAVAALDASLDAGKPVIINVRERSIFTDGGHFMVVAGKTEDGKYIVNDPNIENYLKPDMVDGFMNGFTKEEITQGLSHIYIFGS